MGELAGLIKKVLSINQFVPVVIEEHQDRFPPQLGLTRKQIKAQGAAMPAINLILGKAMWYMPRLILLPKNSVSTRILLLTIPIPPLMENTIIGM
jgi:hypothetical protein